MSKYSYEEKLAAVKLVVDEGLSDYEAARISGIAKTPIQRWVARYRQFGVKGIVMKFGTYDGAFKISVIEYMHKNHLSLSQAAVKFGIPNESTVSKWERIYYEEGAGALFRDNRGRPRKMTINKPKKPKLSKETGEDLIA